jgi:hypothetical protein
MKKRTHHNSRYGENIAFLDLLFNIMLAFVFLFVVAFVLINNNQKKTIEPKAEMMIILTWPDYAADDIDIWLQHPNGQPIWWMNKNGGLVNLERDDLGLPNDITTTPDGYIKINPINREVIIFRGLVPGVYQANVHVFAKRGPDLRMSREQIDKIVPLPYKVQVELVRLNPAYQSVTKVELLLEQQGQELSAFGFTILPDGTIANIDNVERKFAAPPSFGGHP